MVLLQRMNESKILLFHKKDGQRKCKWTAAGQPVEQTKQFKYLGVTFQMNLSWNLHFIFVKGTAMSTEKAIPRVYYSSGEQYVLQQLKHLMLKFPGCYCML